MTATVTTTRQQSRPSQCARLLALLQARGREGVTALDFLGPQTADGGPTILRLPSRADDLRRRGYSITSRMVRTRGGSRVASYRLEGSTPSTPRRPAPQPEPAQTAMLDPSEYGHRPMCAINDTEVE